MLCLLFSILYPTGKSLLALLVCNSAGSLAGRLAGSLTLAAAALSGSFLKVSLVNGNNMLH